MFWSDESANDMIVIANLLSVSTKEVSYILLMPEIEPLRFRMPLSTKIISMVRFGKWTTLTNALVVLC